VGDADGVVAIRHDEIGDVLRLAQERENAETLMMERLRNGALTIDLLNLRPLVDAGTQ
jgi:4-hydroxy-4-methyl-2-oxoglutarate aldolase